MDKTIQIKCRGADVASIDDLLELQGNLKELSDKNYSKLHDIFLTKGFRAPIFIWVNPEGQKQILDGHQRIRTLRRMRDSEGYTIPPLPIDYIEAENKKDAKETLLTFVSQYGKVTEEGFYEFTNEPNFVIEPNFSELLDIPNLDFEYGNKPPVIEDEAPAVNDKEPAISQLGEVYQLGRHRLMCGDSTKIEDVEKLMNGQKADMIFTDPPYGIDYQDTKRNFDKIENDATNPFQLIRDSLSLFQQVPAYICCNWQSMENVRQAMDDAGFDVKTCIVWDKGTRIQNLDKFYKRHEFILYSGVYGGEKTVDGDVWDVYRETRDDHPTAKPIDLITRAIRHSASIGDKVVDLFGGSGSTLIACEQADRTCYMMELDSKYVDVIRRRYAKFIGQADNWEEVTSPI